MAPLPAPRQGPMEGTHPTPCLCHGGATSVAIGSNTGSTTRGGRGALRLLRWGECEEPRTTPRVRSSASSEALRQAQRRVRVVAGYG
ncbi:hypothetical protein ACP70R_037881 [Stipagrostis hirtigluma subsp. patula]